MLSQLLIGYALTVALVVARISAFVVVSPFPGQGVPKTQRAALVIALTAAALSTAEPVPRFFDLVSVAPTVVRELALGALVGLTFRGSLAAADVAGELASHALGLGRSARFRSVVPSRRRWQLLCSRRSLAAPSPWACGSPCRCSQFPS